MEKVKLRQNCYVMLSHGGEFTTAERFYAFAVFVSLLLQFCTVVSDIFIQSTVAYIVTAVDLAVWGFAWISLAIEKKDFEKQLKAAFPAVILFIILAVKILIAQNFSNDYFAPSQALYQIYSLLYAILWGLTARTLPAKLKRKILFWFYVMLTITVIPSYFYVFSFTDALRYGELYGCVDFQYIYAMLPLVGLTIITLLQGNLCGKTKNAMICMVVSNSGIILISNFATAMVLLCFSVFLGLIFTKKMRFKKLLFLLTIIAVLILIFKNVIAEIVLVIGESNLWGTVMKHRFQDIAKLLKGDGIGWSFTARNNLMLGSWRSFLRYPILGVPFDYTGSGVIGFHETWVTLLGYGGIVGLLLVIGTLILYFRCQIRAVKNSYFKNACFSMLLVTIVLSFLNPVITKSNLMIILGIMPMLSCFFASKKERDKPCKTIKSR